LTTCASDEATAVIEGGICTGKRAAAIGISVDTLS